jgi:hypothetical protein
VIPTDPIRLAARGPSTHADVQRALRPLQPDDAVGLAVAETRVDRARLEGCVASGMRARLPAGVTIVVLDAERGAAMAELAAQQGAWPAEAAPAIGVPWGVLVRDSTDQLSQSRVEPFGAGGSGGGIFGLSLGQTTDYTLRLQAELLDLRAGQRLGSAGAFYAAHGGGALVAGIAGGAGGSVAFAVPFVLPVIRLPAGTSAMAICEAFGRAIGDGLVRATTPAPEQPAEPAATAPEAK